MLNYEQITQLFGEPLNTVQMPKVPFKLKAWHVAVIAVAGGLMAYGGYCLYQKYIKNENTEPRKKFRNY